VKNQAEIQPNMLLRMNKMMGSGRGCLHASQPLKTLCHCITECYNCQDARLTIRKDCKVWGPMGFVEDIM